MIRWVIGDSFEVAQTREQAALLHALRHGYDEETVDPFTFPDSEWVCYGPEGEELGVTRAVDSKQAAGACMYASPLPGSYVFTVTSTDDPLDEHIWKVSVLPVGDGEISVEFRELT